MLFLLSTSNLSGYINNGFSGRLSGNGSSDNLSEDHTPDSSLHGAVFPNKRKQSLAKAFINKALPNRKKKRCVQCVIVGNIIFYLFL